MNINERALEAHAKWKGKLEVNLKMKIENKDDLSVCYTPGVAAPCLEIAKDETLAYKYTGKSNLVAVITDGSAVLGLGNIGPLASMPVMEGKAALFKAFAGIDAVSVVVDTNDVDEFVKTVKLISKSYGGINLEDISAPRCFEIEDRLKEECDIPVFHDDQHGTAIITCAALINALKVANKKEGEVKIVINGVGAAGVSIANLILEMNLGKVLMCDTRGILTPNNSQNTAIKEEMARKTNSEGISGSLSDALAGADVAIGVSSQGAFTPSMISSMNENSIVFAMANPSPEILPDEAIKAGALIAATGRSDFPNQINNVLVFPGIFKGALQSSCKQITEEMKMAAARAIAATAKGELSPTNIIPDVFDKDVVTAVAEAVISEYNKEK